MPQGAAGGGHALLTCQAGRPAAQATTTTKVARLLEPKADVEEKNTDHAPPSRCR